MATTLLDEDIVFLIFKEINQSTPQYLRGMRLVSKKFNNLVTPFVYSTTTITPRILTALTSKKDPDHTPLNQLQVLRDLTRFTRQLVIDQTLAESTLVGVLGAMMKLHSIRCVECLKHSERLRANRFRWPYWNKGHEGRREAAVVAAVMTQGSSLRTLHVWRLSNGSLRTLAQACIQLEELTIQAYALVRWPYPPHNIQRLMCCKPNLGSPKSEYNPLSMFGKLQNLMIFTTFRELSPFVAGEFTTLKDARNANVQNWVETLISTKQGLPFEKIIIRGKTRESAPMEEWPVIGHDPYLDALYVTLPLSYTYKRTASETEGKEHITLQNDSNWLLNLSDGRLGML